MRNSLRLAIFGLGGVAIAIAVGLAQSPDLPRPHAPPLAVRVVSESDTTLASRSSAGAPRAAAAAETPSPIPDHARSVERLTAEAANRATAVEPSPQRTDKHARLAEAPLATASDSAVALNRGAAASSVAAEGVTSAPQPPMIPTLVPASPAYGQAAVPAVDNEKLTQAYEFLRQQLSGGSGTASPTNPLAAPGQSSAAAPPSGKASASTSAAGRNGPPPQATIDADKNGKLAIHLQNADLRDVLDLLSEQGGLNILAGNSVQGKVSATLNGVDIESALDAILKSTGFVARRDGQFIFVGTVDEFNTLEQSLDRIGTRVYRPNYVSAVELQKLIQPMLTERVGVVSVTTASEKGIASDANTAGGDSFSGSDVVLVRDYEAVLSVVDEVVANVDVRPLQVHIEAMILSVKLKADDHYGVDFQLLRNQKDLKFGIGAPPSDLGQVKFEDGAIKFGFLDGSLGAFLDALETIGDTDVIATPRLMVINKQRAEIQIGEQKGYVSTTVTETASTQSVQFLDIGALLRLRPFISSDGIVRMEVHPELSDGQVNTDSGFTLPEKEVTQVTTNIMVRDGCTVVIGGLMRDNLTSTVQQLPLLGNLPVVGFLFRNTTESTERREVLVLITPHIVYEPESCAEGEQAACEFHRRHGVFADKFSPLNKRSLGRRYFRMAQGAWAAGDRDQALRFVELSLQFDPESRAAIDLRSDIWLGKTDGRQCLQRLGNDGAGCTLPDIDPQGAALTGAGRAGAGSLPAMPGDRNGAPPRPAAPLDSAAIDSGALPDFVLDDVAGPSASHPPVNRPRDPGQPGPKTTIVKPRRLD